MEAVKEDLLKLGAPSLEKASPSLTAAELDIMKEGGFPDLQAPIDYVCEVKLMDNCDAGRAPHVQGPKDEGVLVAECAAEYRRNVSQMQDLMLDVPRLQDPISKEKLVEVCTTEDCGNVSDLPGPIYALNEVDLVCDVSDLPGLVELVERCTTKDCGNGCGLQHTTNVQIKEDMVECAAENCTNVWPMQYLTDDLSGWQLVKKSAVDVCKKAADLQGPVLKMELKDSCGMVNLHKVKLMEDILLEDPRSVSSFQGMMLNLSKVDSEKENSSKDCNNVSDLHTKVNMVEYSTAENCDPALDLHSLLSIMGEMLHAEGCLTENVSYESAMPKNVTDMKPDGEPKTELCVILQGFKQLPAYLLAEVVMNMSTVAVFLTQHAPSSADTKRDDVRTYSVPVEAYGSSAGNQKDGMSQKAASSKANTCLLASSVIPYIKLLGEHYKRSLGSDLRRSLHEAKLIEFRGYGPDPAPDWMPCHVSELLSQYGYLGYKEGSFNPLLERIWLPWAQSVEFYHDQDVAMICDQETLRRGLHYKTLASLCLSWAIPTRPVLEYMIAMSPQGKIAEIGSGLGYWAALLKKLGADIVAVDDFSEKTIPSALYFPETIPIDGENFLRQGGAHGCALFFCWPLKSWNRKDSLGVAYKQTYQTCLAEACLDAYLGDIVFFVGEKNDGCTFDMAAWMQRSPKHRRTWRLEKEIDIPSWPGVHDVFMCFVRQNEPNKHSSGKKKKKAAKKAQQVEHAHFLQLEKSVKEEDFRKASFAAYPNCSMQ